MGSWSDPTSSHFMGGGIGGQIVDPFNLGGRSSGGIGGKGKEGPSAPDFVGAANTQIQANRPNQNNPFSTTSWTQDANGNWTQNIGLNGGLAQGVNNLSNQIGGQGSLGTGDQARQQAIDAAYAQAASRLDPQWAQREESTRAQLAAQGLDPSSQAYQSEMGNFDRSRNDAYTSAMSGAIGQGTAAGHLAFQDNLAAQNAPYQQLGNLQNLSNPSPFMGASGLVDAMGQQYQGDLNKYATQQAGKNSQMSGAAQLAMLAML